jgi:hypothetical protein
MDNDSSNLENLYKKQILSEVYYDGPEFNKDPHEYGYRIKGRHIMPKREIPQPRKDYPHSKEEFKPDYTKGSEYDIYGKEDDSPEYLDPDRTKKLEDLSKEKSSSYKVVMSYLRSQIDELKDKSKKLEGLSLNRELMDDIINDLVLGLSTHPNVQLTHVSTNGDPIFSFFDKENRYDKSVQVEIPFGLKSNIDDIKYLKIHVKFEH